MGDIAVALLGSAFLGVLALLALAALAGCGSVLLYRGENQTRRSEARLRETLNRYTFLADAMPEMVWTARADGSIDYFNQRWLQYTGLTLEQARGWGWCAAIHPEDLAPCSSCVENCGSDV